MFRFEKDMMPIIEEALSFKYSGAKFIHEFNSGNGVSDLTIATFNEEMPQISIRNYTEMYYLTNYIKFDNHFIKPEKLINEFNLEKKTLLRLLNKLVVGKYLEKEDDCYRVIKRYKPAVKCVISIELKLKKWKEGFYQALRYQSFSHLSFLAISADFERNVDKNLLNDNAIGLISVSKDFIRFVIEPPFQKPNDTAAYYHLSESMI